MALYKRPFIKTTVHSSVLSGVLGVWSHDQSSTVCSLSAWGALCHSVLLQRITDVNTSDNVPFVPQTVISILQWIRIVPDNVQILRFPKCPVPLTLIQIEFALPLTLCRDLGRVVCFQLVAETQNLEHSRHKTVWIPYILLYFMKQLSMAYVFLKKKQKFGNNLNKWSHITEFVLYNT